MYVSLKALAWRVPSWCGTRSVVTSCLPGESSTLLVHVSTSVENDGGSLISADQEAGQAIGIPSDMPVRATTSHRKTGRAASFGHALGTA